MASTHPPSPRFGTDHGSIIPEFALVAPFMVMLVLGIFEFGMAWRNANVLAASLRTSARTITQAQNDGSATATNADLLGMLAYTGSISTLRNATTLKVIVYDVDLTTNPNATVPSACTTTSTAGSPPYNPGSGIKCNIYTAAMLTTANLVPANFGCASSDYDYYYCPTTRSTAITGTGPSTVGVWAQVKYTYVTKLLPGGSITMTDRAISRVEPPPIP